MIAWKSPHAQVPAEAPAQVSPPIRAPRAGQSPHAACASSLRGAALLTTCAIVAFGVAACAGTDANQVTDPVVLGMTSTTAPLYDDGQTTIYEVRTEVPLPVRRVTNEERQTLGKQEPYPRAPFLLTGDVRVEIRYTLSNLDDKDQNIELLLDPWNEFVRYVPGVQVSEERTQPNFSGYDKLIVVPARSRVLGTITSDDTNELAVDLATAENILANPPDNPGVSVGGMINHVFNLQNRSNDGDPLITPFIPKVIAGLTGFDLGIRTYAQANVAVEIIIDIIDEKGNRALPPGSEDRPMGVPDDEITPPQDEPAT